VFAAQSPSATLRPGPADGILNEERCTNVLFGVRDPTAASCWGRQTGRVALWSSM